MPDRAVLLARQRDRALDRVAGDLAFDGDVSVMRTNRCGSSCGAIGDQVRPQAAERVAAPGEDVCDINRHAAGQREGERLHRRRPGDAGAVERYRGLSLVPGK